MGEGGANGDEVKEEPVGEGGATGEEGEEGEGGAKGDEVKNEVKKEEEPVGRVKIARKELTELQERSNELKAMLMGSSMSRAAASAEQPRLTDVKKEEEEDCFSCDPEEMAELGQRIKEDKQATRRLRFGTSTPRIA